MDPRKQDFNQYFKLDFPSVNSFKEARALYEKTKPIKSKKRSELDVRPIGSNRRQTRFQIHKISDTEYSLVATYLTTLGTLKYAKDWVIDEETNIKGRRMLSFHKNGQMHIHCAIGTRKLWRKHSYGSDFTTVIVNQSASNQTWNFLSQILPDEMHIEAPGKYKRKTLKTYLVIDGKYYLLPNEDYVLKLRRREGKWHVMNPYQEYSIRLRKDVIAFVRRAYKTFWPYAAAYWDLVPETAVPRERHEPSQLWTLMIKDMILEPWEALVRMRNYGRRPTDIGYWKKGMREFFYQALPAAAFVKTPVPVGKRCYKPKREPSPSPDQPDWELPRL